jgi:hypothetical protein
LEVRSLGPGSVVIGVRKSGDIAPEAGFESLRRCEGSLVLLGTDGVFLSRSVGCVSPSTEVFGDLGGVGVAVTALVEVASASCFRAIGAGEMRSCAGAPREGFEIGDNGDLAREGEGGLREGCCCMG